MTDVTLELADVERLAGALDAIDLDDKNRATLHAIFGLAGQATAGENEAEVRGYVDEASPRILSGNLIGSFQWGLGRGISSSTGGSSDQLSDFS